MMSAGRQVVTFDELPGWAADDHMAALACLRVSARTLSAQSGIARPLQDIFEEALAAGTPTASQAREFFETSFIPVRLAGRSRAAGFVTGYFEPVMAASPIPTRRYRFPLYRKPGDLREPQTQTPDYHDRRAIRHGALEGRGLEIAWLASAVDQFFVHVQGSARLEFENGDTLRVGYAAKNGHAYTAIGGVLVRQGHLPLEAVTMDSIRQWLNDNPERADAVMDENRSYIFFREVEPEHPDLGPIGAAGVQLTPGRSIAVDTDHTSFGLPVWIATQRALPHESSPLQRLLIAQDRGSAITGPARRDLFIGSGPEAGVVAGGVRHAADFFVLEPRPDAKP